MQVSQQDIEKCAEVLSKLDLFGRNRMIKHLATHSHSEWPKKETEEFIEKMLKDSFSIDPCIICGVEDGFCGCFDHKEMAFDRFIEEYRENPESDSDPDESDIESDDEFEHKE